MDSNQQLEDRLSEPTPEVIETMRWLEGDVILLGVAGKMGPSLARMVKRASEAAGVQRKVIGVARFSAPGHEQALQADGIETIRCDLLDEDAVARLPDTRNVLYLAGMKFGATGQEGLTWAMNTWLPSVVCKRYRRSQIVAFSTGNIYGLVPVDGNGSRESDTPQPVGEYAMSCLGRERIFEHFSHWFEAPVALLRLNYACDLRYGVLVDLAQQVWAGKPVNLAMGWFNTIWQGDANAMTLQSFRHTAAPPAVFNMTGPEKISVREVCAQLGKHMDREAAFTGEEAESALLSDSHRAFELLGKPKVSAEQLIEWVARWVMQGGASLGKPTHFESRDGKF